MPASRALFIGSLLSSVALGTAACGGDSSEFQAMGIPIEEVPAKYAAAYVRVLYNLYELLDRGTFTVRIAETEVGTDMARLKAGQVRTGEVIDMGERWAGLAAQRLGTCVHGADPRAVDAFALRIRKSFLSA